MTFTANFDLSGVKLSQLNEFSKNYLPKLKKTIESDEIGFLTSLNEDRYLSESKKIFTKHSNKTQFYHVGIGGSSLGPEMLLSALQKNNNMTFEYLNNVDPDDTISKLEKIKNINDTIFYIVSKSGGTAETIATFITIINILKEKFQVPLESINDYIVLCTDEKNGDLRKVSADLNLDTLIVPSDVGGRFSVLTPVGYLPALFAGINCDTLIKSALKSGREFLNNPDSELYKTGHIVSSWQKRNINQTVLMPYSSKLKNFTSWFVQLWAESLGKKENLKGEIVHTGFTPIAAYGSTDQHSQMQLFMDGPRDKLFFLLEIKNFFNSVSLENEIDLPSFQLLSKTTLENLMSAEFEGAKKAMTENNLPLVSLAIEQLNEQTLGSLIIFFELLTALMGEIMEINPFDQPGVELGKVYTKQILSKA
jgi:glucose-6-phosphate isomerase